MNIQDKIRSNLNGLRGVPSADFNSHDFNFARDYARQINDALSVNIPIKSCEFVGVVSFSTNTSNAEYLLLTKLTKADSGISFSQSSDLLFVPTPTVQVGSFSIESFIPRTWKGQIANLYYRQFDEGMLGCCYERPDFTIAWMEIDEDTVTSPSESLVASFKKNMEILKAKSQEPVEYADIFLQPDVATDSLEIVDERLTSEILHPLITYKRCNFSMPKFNIDPSSNDFIKMSMDVTYKDIVTELVS